MSSLMFRSLTTNNPDSDRIKIILDEMYDYCKKGILKVKHNLDIIYGASSDEEINEINQLDKQLKLQITTFFDDVVLESNTKKNNTIKYIEELLSEKEVLEKELQMNILISDYNDTTPLIDVKIGIDKALKEYRQIKEERMTVLKKLQEEEKQICQLLNEKPMYSGVKDIPSETLLKMIKNHLTDLKNTKIKRWSMFLEQKAKVELLIASLEEVPILQFYKMVLGDPNQFQLSKSNLDELQKLIKHLEDQTDNQNCMAKELRRKLNSLWDRLQIDVTYRENFVCRTNGYGKTVIHELKREVERCVTLKNKNIKQLIEKLRDELNDLWNRCHFGERQKQQCHVYYNTEFNEDVMDLLEIEVDNVQQFYTHNISIFNLIEERAHLCNKIMKMQEQANDPARYWQNRGGQLLKEEKERKYIQKKLPRIEKELKNQLQLYEQNEGKPFLYNDERLLDVIDQSKEERSKRKNVQQTKSKIQNGNKPQTSQMANHNKKKIAMISINQASRVPKVRMDQNAVIN